ncbi:MAG TPA: hypothetical protein DG414_07115 [Gammaproteobacteria bacterium]|jgi:hypothetical protein|nr:hypothetical protein [Arenicellales bacterium]MDP6531074.1 hypothetical protein [Arenicellales bacterium]MDP6855094.1 hypothetical protein [Arenicellales bacterium]MDP6948694.1 hypothetical protein [Arenicellales bacterium]HCY13592.1 hypothetical protein [Gammaproteobacteria bacterium]|tara:strand:+ start:1034 stop:1408 length:375 start_codon:yes stop_codon:yes gene_type:complete
MTLPVSVLKPLLIITCVAGLALGSVPARSQQPEQTADLLRSIRALVDLRSEILVEFERLKRAPAPATKEEAEMLRLVEEDITLTLAEIAGALEDFKRRYRNSEQAAATTPPASANAVQLPVSPD